MHRCTLFVAAEGSSIDQKANTLSIFNILEELQSQIKTLPRFDRINGDASGVLIYDRELKETKSVHVSVKPNGVKCDFHQTDNCEHVKFALSLPDVQEMIRKRRKEGWKIELPEES